MGKYRKLLAIAGIICMTNCLTGCGNIQKEDVPKESTQHESIPKENSKDEGVPEKTEQDTLTMEKKLESLKQIDSVRKINSTAASECGMNLYEITYFSDEYKVKGFVVVPEKMEKENASTKCIIYNRGGNGDYGKVISDEIVSVAQTFQCIVFASQYRGTSGCEGKDEFGGAELTDVTTLIDICQECGLVDMEQLYMMGISRGGMMTYMTIRNDERIKKAVVISGIADLFMSCEERQDMLELCQNLIGSSPSEAPEEYQKRSATYWADQIKCPVLIIHSKEDEKVSFLQAEKMDECLSQAGIEHKLVTYEDGGHGIHQQDAQVISEWLE